MRRRFGAVVTPEGVGDVVDRGRLGFGTRDAIKVAGMTAGFDHPREEGMAIGDVPFLDTYRTMCLMPRPEFRRVLDSFREMRLVAA